MHALSEDEAKEVIKNEYHFDPFNGSAYTSTQADGGWLFYSPKVEPAETARLAYIVSDNRKVVESFQVGNRTPEELLKKMLASTSPYANPEGMQLNADYIGIRDAGANLDSYDESNETVQRVLHTLGLRENSKLKAISEEYILKDKKVYVDHVSDAYTLAIKTYDAFLDANAAGETVQASTYFVQLFTILEYIKLFRSDSAWSSEMINKVDNMSLLYRYEDSLAEDLRGMAIFDKESQMVDLGASSAFQAFKTRFENLNSLYTAQ